LSFFELFGVELFEIFSCFDEELLSNLKAFLNHNIIIIIQLLTNNILIKNIYFFELFNKSKPYISTNHGEASIPLFRG
jgi:hypothetical protein